MVLPCPTGFPPGIQLGRIPNETNFMLLKFNNLIFSILPACQTGFPPGIQFGRIPNETNGLGRWLLFIRFSQFKTFRFVGMRV
jgi:hypothetical protein